MKVELPMEVDVQETNTQGSHSYVVALRSGGIIEDPTIRYSDYQLINAESEKEACEKYNRMNNCNFYYGHVVKQIS